MNINVKEIFFIAVSLFVCLFFCICFFKYFLNWDSFSTHLKLSTDTFCDITYPFELFKYKFICKLFIKILKIELFFISVLMFHVFVVSFCMLTNWLKFSPLISLFDLNQIQVLDKRSSFTLVFQYYLPCYFWGSKKMSKFKFISFKTHILKVLKYIG